MRRDWGQRCLRSLFYTKVCKKAASGRLFVCPLSGGDTLAPDEDSDGCPDPSAERTVFSESGHGDPPGRLYEDKRFFCPAGGEDNRNGNT